MPRVLRIINRFNLGGPTYNAAYLTKYLSPEFETMLVGGMKDESEESSEFVLKNLGLDYTVIPEMKRSIHPVNDWSAYNRLKKIICQFRPDIVHTHAAKAGALGRRAAFSCKVPVTVHTFHGHVFHSYFNSLQTFIVKKIERGLARKTSAIIAISEKQKKELVEEHGIAFAEKVHVIPLGFDLSRFREKKEEKRKIFREKYLLKNEIAIGIIGRLVPVKNHLFFLEAIKHIRERSNVRIKAFIVGDGESRALLQERSSALGMNDCVVFTSWETEIEKVYPGLDIVCLTSFNEGTPVSLIEAQAAGIPVVSTNVGGIENAVIPGKTAYLSEVGDLTSFCKNLIFLMENDVLRNEMSKDGYNFVKDRFSYFRLSEETGALYRRLLASSIP